MQILSGGAVAGAICTLALFVALGVISGRHVGGAADFNGKGSAGAFMVAGIIIGTLAGGSSTIGTAQLAFNYGLSAWWFTLGASIGCILLAVFFLVPVRQSGFDTIQQIVRAEYGKTAGTITSVLAALGIGINVISQLLSANALMSSMFGLSHTVSIVLCAAVMACYVAFGGTKGTGLLGIVKSALLYAGIIGCTALCLRAPGAVGRIGSELPRAQYFNLFARGFAVDGGAGLSVVLGVISTQTYFQALLAGRSHAAARKGAVVSALLIPPIGLGCILVGYYMRLTHPAMDPGQALPAFILEKMPGFFSGVFLAVLLIAVIGTGAGLTLGMSTILTNNVYRAFRKSASEGELMAATRWIIVASLALTAAAAVCNTGSMILKWGFLSMGLRAVVLLAPMCCALFLPGRVDRRFATASSLVGVAAMIATEVLSLPADALLVGLACSFLTVAAGLVFNRRGVDGLKQK